MRDTIYSGWIRSDVPIPNSQVAKLHAELDKYIAERFKLGVAFTEEQGCPVLKIFVQTSGSELHMREVMSEFVRQFEHSYGLVYCYAEDWEFRRFEIREDRIYSQRASYEFEHPGDMIYMR